MKTTLVNSASCYDNQFLCFDPYEFDGLFLFK